MEFRGENLNMEKYCTSCGMANKIRNKYCNYCGVKLKDVKPKEALNMVKTCPSCGQAIKMSNKFCNYCGVKLEEIEPNQIQIVDTFEKTRKSVIWVSIIVGIILSLIAIALAIIWGDGLNVNVLFGVSIIWIPVLLCILMYAIYYRGARKPRIFTLSDKTIEINIPNKPIFQIGWDEFDTLQIKKRTTGGYHTTYKFFDLFFTGEGYHRTFNLERYRDFTNKSSKRIRDLLGEYAIRLNKEYIYGKKKKKKEDEIITQ